MRQVAREGARDVKLDIVPLLAYMSQANNTPYAFFCL